jgi:hypothetical protein
LALLTTTGPLAAAQAQTQPAEQTIAQPSDEVAEVAEPQPSEAARAPEEDTVADEAGESDKESLQADFRVASRSYNACRQRAQAQGGITAVNSLCASQRKRMLAAKEALREG